MSEVWADAISLNLSAELTFVGCTMSFGELDFPSDVMKTIKFLVFGNFKWVVRFYLHLN